MVPLLVAFLALPCLGEGADNGLSQLIKEEDKFHLLTEVAYIKRKILNIIVYFLFCL